MLQWQDKRAWTVAVHTFSRFFLAGFVGLGVDACIFFLLAKGMGASWLEARIAAFAVAVLVTWRLNRRFTFDTRGTVMREGLSYFAVQGAGCGINYLVFLAVLAWGGMRGSLWFAYLAGSAAALAWNYSLSRCLVFRPGRT